METKKPGIVIFAAVLHFFTVAIFSFLSIFCVLAMLFGAAWGFDQYFREQMTHVGPPNFSYGLAVIFGLALAVFLTFVGVFLAVAIGLLRGKKYAWYMQVALSTLSLFSLPFGLMNPVLPLGAVLNIIILALFFRPRIREYFKV